VLLAILLHCWILRPSAQLLTLPGFVAICSMSFSHIKQPKLQMYIVTKICTVRCKKSFFFKTTDKDRVIQS